MADTYTLISSVTVGAGGAASMDFTSIPQTYTDLKLVISARNTSAATQALVVYANGNSSGIYDQKILYGTGSGSGSGGYTNNIGWLVAQVGGTNDTANTFTSVDNYITNYTGSTYKSVSSDAVEENNGTAAYAYMVANLMKSTSAITSLSIYAYGTNLAQYSTAYLYGIKNS